MKVFYIFGFKKDAAEKLVKHCKYENLSIREATRGNQKGNQIRDVFISIEGDTVSYIVQHAALWITVRDSDQITHRYIDALILLTENVRDINEYVPYVRNLKERIASYENKNDAILTLSTIHSAKGMEWKNVIILDAYEGVLPKTLNQQ